MRSGVNGTGRMRSTVKRAGNVAVPSVDALEQAGQQRRRRAAVLRVGRPRPAGELGGDGDVAVDLEHVSRLGHGGSAYGNQNGLPHRRTRQTDHRRNHVKRLLVSRSAS